MSGAIARIEGEDGSSGVVCVRSAEGEILAFGLHSPNSQIRVRLTHFGKESPGPDWLSERVEAAFARRRGEPGLRETDAMRLVNAEGDGLPGLVIDRFADVCVVKLNHVVWANRREEIAGLLEQTAGVRVAIDRTDAVAARREGFQQVGGTLFGEIGDAPVWIREGSSRFAVDPVRGQKTGFYLDQRDARTLVRSLASGRDVLDLFAYTGGFSVAAAAGGARCVSLVDSSEAALALARRNLAANVAPSRVEIHAADAFEFVRRDPGLYGLVIVDPPPLARRRADLQRAVRAHKDLLLHALQRTGRDGWMLAFACSHHVGLTLFEQLLHGAALDAGRDVQILRRLSPASDHPVSVHHPEGHYLCGLWLRVP